VTVEMHVVHRAAYEDDVPRWAVCVDRNPLVFLETEAAAEELAAKLAASVAARAGGTAA
jgi:hypothetical protein